jgi:hypothetical protein
MYGKDQTESLHACRDNCMYSINWVFLSLLMGISLET